MKCNPGDINNSILATLLILLIENLCAQNLKYTNEWAIHIEGGEDFARDLGDQHGFTYLGKIFDNYYHFEHRRIVKRSTDHSSHAHSELIKHPKVKWLQQQIVKRRVKRNVRLRKDIRFNDPKWPEMWYLNRGPNHGMKVWDAWAQGYTGKGIVVTILDDGIEVNHPDLKNNYDPNASFDVNSNDANPQPRYDYSNENKHGTRCAGEVASQANNNVCNVGVAFDAHIGGVRMLDGDVTDTVEAKSLSHNPQHIHIYSASWGPDDDGRTVDGPSTLARKAFYDGITQGRGGLGSIFVWASGNGGRAGDNCNCDGYTNSIYTLSISSATELGHIPWYSEACSSTLATTYSSGSTPDKQIVTTDLHKGCTDSHTGTSASAPLAAGVVALALQANPALSWRDMQHIVVATANPQGLNAPDWIVNGIGKKVSHSFGFGLMDASAMVQLAKNWTMVGDQHICEVPSNDKNRVVPRNGKLKLHLEVDGCANSRNYVKYLEHVEAKITLTSTRRGAIRIFLTSPMGTRSTLLAHRTEDVSTDGFNNWSFMTTHSWGEIARGTWVLEIDNGDTSAELKSWSLLVMGTSALPQSTSYASSYQFLTHDSGPSHICAGRFTTGVCLECRQGFYLLDENCVSLCPLGYYSSVSINKNYSDSTSNNRTVIIESHAVCKPCDTSCAKCQFVNQPECIQCRQGFSLNQSSKTCQLFLASWLLRHKSTITIIGSICIPILVFLVVLFCVRHYIVFSCSDIFTFFRKFCCFCKKPHNFRPLPNHESPHQDSHVPVIAFSDSDLMPSLTNNDL